MAHGLMRSGLPIIDIGPLLGGVGSVADAAQALDEACRIHGFFYVTNHGIDPALEARLREASSAFFALDEEAKRRIRMELGGAAWRGWFPLGGELTSGRPDQKEGVYFGKELAADDPRVIAGTPLHGPNLFPAEVPELREAVLAWIDALTRLGHAVMSGLALGLGLAPDFFRREWMREPTVLFRLFRYPPTPDDGGDWGVGEHTDYGVLTLLLQDEVGGLQVKSQGRWIDAPPIPGTFVCNIGDMLERMTGGRYLSTPHRVRNATDRLRTSYPLFFDPSFDAHIRPLPLAPDHRERPTRWDGEDPLSFTGTWGEYLVGKVSKVFPALTSQLRKP